MGSTAVTLTLTYLMYSVQVAFIIMKLKFVLVKTIQISYDTLTGSVRLLSSQLFHNFQFHGRFEGND